MNIADAREVESLRETMARDCSQCACVEQAAQRYADQFYRRFAQATVLVRVFATLRFDRLPEPERAYAREVAASAGSLDELRADTDVLTLLGTRGVRHEWNERTNSRGHRAIPLLSEEFVGEIPMIARVLGETGFVPFGAAKGRSQYVMRDSSEGDGLFFVGDARVTTDERGRLIIPAADFVARHGVKTVFGFGGTYSAGRNFVTTIVFCREAVARTTARNFVALGREFKAHTEALMERGTVFAEHAGELA